MMVKEDGIRMIVGAGIILLLSIIAIFAHDGWNFNPWLPVIYGVVIIPIEFPPFIRWTKRLSVKHAILSKLIIIALGIWTAIWMAYSVLTIAGIIR